MMKLPDISSKSDNYVIKTFTERSRGYVVGATWWGGYIQLVGLVFPNHHELLCDLLIALLVNQSTDL